MSFALLTIYCKGSTKDADLDKDQSMGTSADVELARVTAKKDSTPNEETGVMNENDAHEIETETKSANLNKDNKADIEDETKASTESADSDDDKEAMVKDETSISDEDDKTKNEGDTAENGDAGMQADDAELIDKEDDSNVEEEQTGVTNEGFDEDKTEDE